MFTDTVIDKFTEPGQKILRLENVYKEIVSDLDSKNLFNLFTNNEEKVLLKTAGYDIKDLSKRSYELCKFVDVINGHFSELWFAVNFNGRVKGGIKGESGTLASDIFVKGFGGISLKDYNKLTSINCGYIQFELCKELEDILHIISLISGYQINSSLTRNSINKLLDEIDSKEFQDDLEKFLNEKPKSNISKRFHNEVSQIINLSTSSSLSEIVCKKVDEIMEKKINEVEWWGFIHKGTRLYLLDSKTLTNELKCQGNRLNNHIQAFEAKRLRLSITKIIKNF